MSSRSSNVFLWSLDAAAVTVCCFSVNLGGAWYGGPAHPANLFMTVLYMVFWAGFSFGCRTSPIATRAVFWLSLITFFSSMASLTYSLFRWNILFLPAAVLAVFSAVPMYGCAYCCSGLGCTPSPLCCLSAGWYLLARRCSGGNKKDAFRRLFYLGQDSWNWPVYRR